MEFFQEKNNLPILIKEDMKNIAKSIVVVEKKTVNPPPLLLHFDIFYVCILRIEPMALYMRGKHLPLPYT
jgi:hypothetical protein